MLQTIVNFINDFARHIPWDAIVASGVLSPLLVGVKKWLDVQSERVMITLVILFAGITAGANYLLHAPIHDPTVIAVQTAVLAFMTQPVYFFIVKPAIAFFRNEVEKAAQFNLDVKSAAAPKEGISVTYGSPAPTKVVSTSTPVNIQDFKS